jgi:Rieske Fe-S protein
MKLKGTLQWAFLVAILSVLLASCTDYVIKPAKVVVPDSVKFKANIIPIFNASCNHSGCHATGGHAPDLTPANAYTSLIFYGYVDTDNPESSIIYQKITTGSMKANATDQDRDLILKWIQQGALNN